jgi:CHAT domain-containing protein
MRVRYAPTARAVLPAEDSARAHARSVLAVGNPEPTSLDSLPLAADEAVFVRDAVGAGELLIGEEASRQATLDRFDAHPIAHLACHAITHFNAPLESGLIMRGDQMITLTDLITRRLPNTDLVTLSACETAVQDISTHDEALSLATGLLQAGAGAVVGSLWGAPDESTLVLMRHFYDHWLKDDVPVPDALSLAQRDVRDAGRDYAHPVFWAAFGFFGAASDYQSTS